MTTPKDPKAIHQLDLEMIRHARGFDSQVFGYRNHYCTMLNNPIMQDLVERGYFELVTTIGCGMFALTEKGLRVAYAHRGTTVIDPCATCGHHKSTHVMDGACLRGMVDGLACECKKYTPPEKEGDEC